MKVRIKAIDPKSKPSSQQSKASEKNKSLQLVGAKDFKHNVKKDQTVFIVITTNSSEELNKEVMGTSPVAVGPT